MTYQTYDENPSFAKFSSRIFVIKFATTLHINDNIRKAREFRGLTITEIAEKLSLKRTSYTEWEKDTIPRVDLFFKIAEVLGFEPGDMIKEGWQPDDNSSGRSTVEMKKVSLEIIQKGLEKVLHQQKLTRAEVRAYGQYQVGRDARGDKNQIVTILSEIGRLVAEQEVRISREDN